MAVDQVIPRTRKRKPPSLIRIEGDIAFVALTKCMEAQIDVADISLVAGRYWAAWVNSQSGNRYALASIEGRTLPMHRLLTAAPPSLQVDHIDGDGLNNRRANLRLATAAQNQANKAVLRTNKLGLKGVRADGPRFRAEICQNGKPISLGSYLTIEEATAAYCGAAKALWGEYAHTNERGPRDPFGSSGGLRNAQTPEGTA